MKEVLRAFEIVKKLGQEHKSLQGVYYLVDDNYNETAEYGSKNYCLECATKEVEKSGLQIQNESSPENEDFCHCDGCGAVIETSIIWGEAEMEHWVDNLEKDDMATPYLCYELMQILDPTYGAYSKFPSEVTEIAKRVISLATHPRGE